jgi:hypothetical protein
MVGANQSINGRATIPSLQKVLRRLHGLKTAARGAGIEREIVLIDCLLFTN